MITVPEITISNISSVLGHGESLFDLALSAANSTLNLPTPPPTPNSSLLTPHSSLPTPTSTPTQSSTLLNQSINRLIEKSKNLSPSPLAVIAATFSNPERFPSLAVRIASALKLPPSTPAFDLQLACSAFPYAVYLAGKLSADLGGSVLVIDGDVQSPLVDTADHATGNIFSDAVTACLVTSTLNSQPSTPHSSLPTPTPTSHSSLLAPHSSLPSPTPTPTSHSSLLTPHSPLLTPTPTTHYSLLTTHSSLLTSPFAFYSASSDALSCPSTGPIHMDGFKVFSFVATEISQFLREFGTDFDYFAPHQANPYMVRQLAKTLNLEDKLLTIDDAIKNPGSCSVAMALARAPHPGRALIAGFGAGYSASAGIIRI